MTINKRKFTLQPLPPIKINSYSKPPLPTRSFSLRPSLRPSLSQQPSKIKSSLGCYPLGIPQIKPK